MPEDDLFGDQRPLEDHAAQRPDMSHGGLHTPPRFEDEPCSVEQLTSGIDVSRSWLEDLIRRAARYKACTKLHCTTCPSRVFRTAVAVLAERASGRPERDLSGDLANFELSSVLEQPEIAQAVREQLYRARASLSDWEAAVQSVEAEVEFPERSQLDYLLAYSAQGGRVCPMPSHWNRLFQTLRRRHVADATTPLPPLILGAWYLDDEEKRERLAEQLRWADAHGALADAARFLFRLSDTDWHLEGR